MFDFWDGRDGLIDAVKVGDLLRCCGFNPTNALVYKNGGTRRSGKSPPSQTDIELNMFCTLVSLNKYLIFRGV